MLACSNWVGAKCLDVQLISPKVEQAAAARACHVVFYFSHLLLVSTTWGRYCKIASLPAAANFLCHPSTCFDCHHGRDRRPLVWRELGAEDFQDSQLHTQCSHFLTTGVRAQEAVTSGTGPQVLLLALPFSLDPAAPMVPCILCSGFVHKKAQACALGAHA